MKLRLLSLSIVLVLVAASAEWFRLNATPPAGISFELIGRANLPAFDVKRKEKDLDWRIDLTSNQSMDVATQVVTFQPGGLSGWHTHPGPVFFTVQTGTLTVYEGDDPTCTPHVFGPGTGAVEAGTSSHIHMVRNETTQVAKAVVTYLVPMNANPLRTDLPLPGNGCPF